jgi:RNA polymerase sigma factor (TIGR02999 family)
MILVYQELRALAQQALAREPASSILQPTALVHEVYLRMREQRVERWLGRTHFMAVAARAMRRVLLDYARERHAQKRGGGWRRVALEPAASAGPSDVDLQAVSEALDRLDRLNARHCRVVEMRFLAGLSVEETAEVLGISPRTVKMDWRTARAWLLQELGEG